jgi:peptide/nickel transport system substrate-binding protein
MIYVRPLTGIQDMCSIRLQSHISGSNSQEVTASLLCLAEGLDAGKHRLQRDVDMPSKSERSVREEAFSAGGRPAAGLVDEFLSKRVNRREFLTRAAAIGLSASTASALLAACGSGSTSSSPGPAKALSAKTLNWRPAADVKNVDPAILPGLEDPTYAPCFFETLFTYRPGTWERVYCLADSVEQSKNGLQFHFTLKQGIPFQKGYGEVQASDVKYSFERIAGLNKPNLHSPYQGDWAALESVRVDSKYSGTIIMKDIFAPTTATLAGGGIASGCVVSQKAVEKFGKNFGTNPVGTGPYEWTSWVPGQKLVMTKFSDYGGANKAYANKILFEEIQAQPIASDQTAYAALAQGTINYCELGTSTVKTARANSSVNVYSTPSGLYYWLAMNVTEPPLTNIWLRKAIRLAVDVPGIIKDAYDGLYTRTNAIIPPSMHIGYWPGAPQYNQNIALAKSYMSKSGLTNVQLKLNVDNVPSDVTGAQVIAANLAQIGIKVTVEPVDPATIAAIPGPGGGGAHPQLLYYYYGGQADPNVWFEWWTCAQMGLWNWDHWCNPQFTDLTKRALATYDIAERTQLYIEAQRLWDSEAGMVWICNSRNYIGCQPHIKPSFLAQGGLLIWNTTVT